MDSGRESLNEMAAREALCAQNRLLFQPSCRLSKPRCRDACLVLNCCHPLRGDVCGECCTRNRESRRNQLFSKSYKKSQLKLYLFSLLVLVSVLPLVVRMSVIFRLDFVITLNLLLLLGRMAVDLEQFLRIELGKLRHEVPQIAKETSLIEILM